MAKLITSRINIGAIANLFATFGVFSLIGVGYISALSELPTLI